jgi:hypothetical protein
MGFEETHEKIIGHSRLKSAIRAVRCATDDESIGDAAKKVESALVEYVNANTAQWRLVVVAMLRTVAQDLMDAPALYFRELTRNTIRRRLAIIEQNVQSTNSTDALKRFLDSAFEVLDVSCMTCFSNENPSSVVRHISEKYLSNVVGDLLQFEHCGDLMNIAPKLAAIRQQTGIPEIAAQVEAGRQCIKKRRSMPKSTKNLLRESILRPRPRSC